MSEKKKAPDAARENFKALGKQVRAAVKAVNILKAGTPTGWTLRVMAKSLREHNAWRRGDPPYNTPGVPCPVEAQRLGNILDRAAEVLTVVADARAASYPDGDKVGQEEKEP